MMVIGINRRLGYPSIGCSFEVSCEGVKRPANGALLLGTQRHCACDAARLQIASRVGSDYADARGLSFSLATSNSR